RPDQTIAERAERATQRFPQPLDLIGRSAVVFCAGSRANREAGEIGMRIEEMRAARDGWPVLAIAQIAQQRLFGDANAHAEHALVVVRALHGEQPQQRTRERAVYRTHIVARMPPPKPAANHARFGPRPTSRSVPEAPAASAVPTAATARSSAPRTVSA